MTVELKRRNIFQRNLRIRIGRTGGGLYVERKGNEESRVMPFWFEQL